MARSFASPISRVLDFSALDLAPICVSGWEAPIAKSSHDINWVAFLRGAQVHPLLVDECALNLSHRKQSPNVSTLIHVVKLFHDHGAFAQHLPTNASVAEQLREMRRAAAKLSQLAQGGDGKGQPVVIPDWFSTECGIDIESDGSLRPGLTRAVPDVHPLIHEALHGARASLSPGGSPQGEGERKAWTDVGAFFTLLRLGLGTIDTAIEQIEAAEYEGSVPAHRPRDAARKWALSRLLWIWRDIVQCPVNLGMTTIHDKVELNVPEPGPCISFVIAALEHIAPVQPHRYRALRTELSRAEKVVPEENLVKS